MANNILIDITQQWEDRDIRLARQFAGLVQKRLNLSPLFAQTNPIDKIKVEAGKLVFYRAGADEELESVYGVSDFNDVSNVYEELEIPFIIKASTKAIRFSKEEWVQTLKKGGMDEQSLSVKADKFAKVIARVAMSLWFNGTVPYKGNQLKLGDGAIPVVPFQWTTTITGGEANRKEVAEEFDKVVLLIGQQVNKIRNIGLKDEDGKNAYDAFRTGVNVGNVKLATSNDFRLRWEIWSSYFKQNNQAIEEGSYGRILGFSLYEDAFLPFVGGNIDETWTKDQTYQHSAEKLQYVETNKRIEVIFFKGENLISGTTMNYPWSVDIPKTNGATLKGWNVGFGAGTVFPDEMFGVDFSGNSTPVALDTVITTKALGEISDNEPATILAGVVAKNTSVAVGDIAVDGTPTDTGATIKSSGSKYTGTVAVSFTIKASEKK